MAHIEKRGPKRYRARYRSPQGRERSKTFERKSDAEQWLATQEQAKQVGEWADPALGRLTFGHFAERWVELLVDRKPKTIETYKSLLRLHVLPELGDVQVARIDRPMIRRFLADLAAKGKGPGTVKNALNVIKPVLNVAVEAGALRSSPARGISAPRSQPQEMRFLSAEQVEHLAEAIHPRYRTLVVTAAYTGLRAGELVALRVKDLDLMRGRLHVRESASEVGSGLVFGPTKNHQQRSVALPRFLVDELAAHLAERGVATDREAFVFTDTEGGPLRQSNFYRRVYKPAVIDAGLDPKLRFHDLRHTAAALMIELGAHPRAMMERLGHSSVTVTLDTYGHLLPSLDEALTVGLEDRRRAAISNVSRPGRGLEHPSLTMQAGA